MPLSCMLQNYGQTNIRYHPGVAAWVACLSSFSSPSWCSSSVFWMQQADQTDGSVTSGIGGDAFALHFSAATKKVEAFLGCGRSPAKMTLDVSLCILDNCNCNIMLKDRLSWTTAIKALFVCSIAGRRASRAWLCLTIVHWLSLCQELLHSGRIFSASMASLALNRCSLNDSYWHALANDFIGYAIYLRSTLRWKGTWMQMAFSLVASDRQAWSDSRNLS